MPNNDALSGDAHPEPPRGYPEGVAWLTDRINYERTPAPRSTPQRMRLERVRNLIDRLGAPDAGMRIVHVAGTKGKGSTSMMVASALTAAGYRTGLYTSPHLERLEERFVIDGAECSPAELLESIDRVRPVVGAMDSSPAERGITFFDIMTAMAFDWFRRRGAEVVVLEVGLGGRLDSTNVCNPTVSVITSISLDHTRQLGNTVEAIAAEKAGIIKPGVPVVSGVVEPGPQAVIAAVAKNRGSRLVQRGVDFGADYLPHPSGSILGAAAYWSRRGEETVPRGPYALAMAGRRQTENAAVAVATLDQLSSRGVAIDERAIAAGLAAARLPARFEVFPGEPTVVIDCAHNDASAAALAESLLEFFSTTNRTIVLAISRDKDAQAIVQRLAPAADRWVATRFLDNPRALSPEEVAKAIRSQVKGAVVRAVSTPVEAWREGCSTGGLVCFCGSIFLAGEVRRVARAEGRYSDVANIG